MAKIFLTGSSDGLGLLAGKAFVAQGHEVVLHARNEKRANDAVEKCPEAEAIVIGDLGSIDETKEVASKVNALGDFDVVIHNAGIYSGSGKDIFTVNTLAPYILTGLITRPKRLIYISSGMHMNGHFRPEDFKNNFKGITYSDSKLYIVMLCKAVARKWSNVYSNAVDPGWVPTKMGGSNAPDDLEKGYETQVWLATSNDKEAKVSGQYFFHNNEARVNLQSSDVHLQERLLAICKEITGVTLVSG